MMSQKIVVIQDASRDVNCDAIRWVVPGFSLQPGDELTLLGVLHQVYNPMGYKSTISGSNVKIVEEELARNMEEFRNNTEIKQLFKQCKIEKIKFHIELIAGPSPTVIAVGEARKLKATWVILDRHMKKDKKYYLENLSCGISRMKRDNNIEKLRGPKAIKNSTTPSQKCTSGIAHVSYDEMIPGLSEEEISPNKSPADQQCMTSKEKGVKGSVGRPSRTHKKIASFSLSSFSEMFSCKISSSTAEKTETSFSSFSHDDGDHTKTMQEKVAELPSFSGLESHKRGQDDGDGGGIGGCLEKELPNSICSDCKNRRPMIGWKKDFTYAELYQATKGFYSKNFLSEGGFGSVYRGKLKNGLKIAVKQHNIASFQGEREFKSEVHVLSKARHQNLVMLLGSCSEGSHRLLVYEYVCNGSLDQHLSNHTRRPLNWDERIKIALGAARGLEYLHNNNIIHRDVRPNNILVTHDYESLLGDFGLARNQYDDSDRSSESRIVGSLGYFAPEYAECGQASTKSDVYSFGVVLLQLITGKRTTDKIHEGKSLIGWARPLLAEKKYDDLIDQRITDNHDVHKLFWMVRVAERCLREEPDKRYNMEWVVNALNYIKQGHTSHIRDLFPTVSDSATSVAESTELEVVGRKDSTKLSTAICGSDQASASVSSLSGSPSSERLLRSNITKIHAKKKGRSHSRGELLYDEMMI